MISEPTKEGTPTLGDKQGTECALENPVLPLSEVGGQMTLLIPGEEMKASPKFLTEI